MGIMIFYVTCSDEAEARKIAKSLLEERLIACANIYTGISSLYWWEGKIQEDNEVVIILKTKEELTQKVIAKIKALHSYECPCILSFSVKEGYEPFLNWIKKETEEAGRDA
ncbi:divalent-cation tolerance protein CutA [Thermodesulfatator autotrophicus]|uniref:Dihydroorotate dehydrogenase n=1 Tax=Thermodesulfatator autotrophicus TaxID=1795632 RepID=A0A177E8R6_9BACT|nr:divalent-cation tolerance protein CutA [Thermodesulfatator autotrophicus]OAG27881.1 dihydroorotate dehydrogenase [Thermodesulfatator autotrophicus]